MFHNNQIKSELPFLSLPMRALFTGYIMVIGIGLLMAGIQILLTHGMADGKFGLSVDDIIYSYRGNSSSSKLEAKLKGSMQDKASAQVKREIISWAQHGASKTEWDAKIGLHFQQNCVRCHSVIPGLPSFTTYEGVLPLAKIDMGESIETLTRVSHIHLFGIAFIFFFVGYIFSYAIGISSEIKSIFIFFPFFFLLLDVMSWWLIKWYPDFALLTLASGLGYAFSVAIMLTISLYQMWIMPKKIKP